MKYNEYLKILIDQNSLSRENLRAVAQKAVKVDMDEFSIVVKSVLDNAGIDDSSVSSILRKELINRKTILQISHGFHIGEKYIGLNTTYFDEFVDVVALMREEGFDLDAIEEIFLRKDCTIKTINGLDALPNLHAIHSGWNPVESFEMPIGGFLSELYFQDSQLVNLPDGFVEKLNDCRLKVRRRPGLEEYNEADLTIDFSGTALYTNDVWEDKVDWSRLVDSVVPDKTFNVDDIYIRLRTNNTHPINKTKVQFDRKNVPEWMVDIEYLKIYHKHSPYSDRYVPENTKKSTKQSGGCF